MMKGSCVVLRGSIPIFGLQIEFLAEARGLLLSEFIEELDARLYGDLRARLGE